MLYGFVFGFVRGLFVSGVRVGVVFVFFGRGFN